MNIRKKFFINGALSLVIANSLLGCALPPPSKPDNICSIFTEHPEWYVSAKEARDKWRVPIQVPMAMMFQESSFKHNAKPPMRYLWSFIPIGRTSDAYGYAQAKTMTWGDYVKNTGRSWASRSNFYDAIDFMGWYVSTTHKINKVSKWDAEAQYLNYHDGWGGYKRRTYVKKKWLVKVAKKVGRRAKKYSIQYKRCKNALDKQSVWFSSFY